MPFRVINMSQQEMPKFVESNRYNWISYGDNNNLSAELIDLMNSSAKHASLLKKKADMTAGNGFVETIGNAKLLKNVYGKDPLSVVAYKCAYDLMIYGGYYLAITWSKDNMSIARVEYLDWSKVRIAKQLDDDSDMAKLQGGGLEFYYVSADWNQYRKDRFKPKLVQGFSQEFKDEKTQIIAVQEYRPGTDFYVLPDYIAGKKWIQLDAAIADFHLSSTENGYTPSMIVNFKGPVPSDEELDILSGKMQKKYAGTNNGSRIFLTFSDNKDMAPDFIPINLNASDERFLKLEEHIQANLIVTHRASPIVAGIATAGKLGSTAEIEEAEEVFERTVIDQKKRTLMRGFDIITDVNGLEDLELRGIKTKING